MVVLLVLAISLMIVGALKINAAAVNKKNEQRIFLGDTSLAFGISLAWFVISYGDLRNLSTSILLMLGMLMIATGIVYMGHIDSKYKHNQKMFIGEMSLVIGEMLLFISVTGLLDILA